MTQPDLSSLALPESPRKLEELLDRLKSPHPIHNHATNICGCEWCQEWIAAKVDVLNHVSGRLLSGSSRGEE